MHATAARRSYERCQYRLDGGGCVQSAYLARARSFTPPAACSTHELLLVRLAPAFHELVLVIIKVGEHALHARLGGAGHVMARTRLDDSRIAESRDERSIFQAASASEGSHLGALCFTESTREVVSLARLFHTAAEVIVTRL